MFLTPDETTLIELTKWFQFEENRAEYNRLAANSCQMNAQNSLADFLAGVQVKDQAPSTFNLEAETVIPARKRSPFTGLPIPPDKQFRTSNVILYDRDDLRQHLPASANPICVVKGKPLRERAENIIETASPFTWTHNGIDANSHSRLLIGLSLSYSDDGDPDRGRVSHSACIHGGLESET
jgi:hypothetical protein